MGSRSVCRPQRWRHGGVTKVRAGGRGERRVLGDFRRRSSPCLEWQNLRLSSLADRRWLAHGWPVCRSQRAAAYLNLGLALSLGLLLSPVPGGRRQGHGVLAGCFAAVTAAGVLASHSRSGFVALLALLGVVAFAVRPRLHRAAAAFAAGSVVVGLVLYGLIGSNPTSRLVSLAEAEAYTDRFEIWRAALAAWAARPFFGWGLGTFLTASGPYFIHDRGVIFARAENEYLDMLTEGGLVGLGLSLWGMGSVLQWGCVALRQTQWISCGPALERVSGGSGTTFLSSRRETALVAGGLAGLAALLAVQSLGDFSPHIPGVAIPALVLAAHLVGLGLGRLPVSSTPRGALWAWLGVIALGLTAVVGQVLPRAAPKLASPVPECRRPGRRCRWDCQ